MDAARQVLQWEQAAALAEARDAGWSEAQLGLELGVPAVKVAGILTDMTGPVRLGSGRRPGGGRSTAAGLRGSWPGG